MRLSWTKWLPVEVEQRLIEYRNTKADLKILVHTRYKYMKQQNPNYTRTEALIDVLDVLMANYQQQLANISSAEWEELTNED